MDTLAGHLAEPLTRSPLNRAVESLRKLGFYLEPSDMDGLWLLAVGTTTETVTPNRVISTYSNVVARDHVRQEQTAGGTLAEGLVKDNPFREAYEIDEDGKPRDGRKPYLKPEEVRPLPDSLPAVKFGFTKFISRVADPLPKSKIFTSCSNLKRIGGTVEKSRWKGLPIYYVALEERASCPRSCLHWANCCGNHEGSIIRYRHGPALEHAIEDCLERWSLARPRGFLIWLHRLGDFYSMDYVCKWEVWLNKFPALMVFGYTAHHPHDSQIGRKLALLSRYRWDRFAMRFSNYDGDDLPSANTIAYTLTGPKEAGGSVCPVMLPGAPTPSCAACGLCWAGRDKPSLKRVVFVLN